jgi:type II secretory pathway pseudopilin PulG
LLALFVQRGFTLLELTSILLLMSVLAALAISKAVNAPAALLTGRDGIVAALSHAQQIAMARDSAANPITFQINADSVAVQESGADAVSPGAEYPFSLPNGVSVTGGLGTLHYDKLGRTTPTVISLNSGQATITVEASGYAH